MGETTGITWADSTFNGWIGCTKVTDACQNCYAETLANRMGWVKWGHGEERRLTSDSTWRLPLKWDAKAGREGRVNRTFAFSLADVFDTEVPKEWRMRFFSLIEQTKHTAWLVLTKRASLPRRYAGFYDPNKVWLGTSLGSDHDLHMAEEIVKAPAAVHWISYEPALGPLDVYRLPQEIKWLVIGGESGTQAREFNIDWALEAIEKAQARNISVFMKQLGRRPTVDGAAYPVSDSHGKLMEEWPPALRIQEFPL